MKIPFHQYHLLKLLEGYDDQHLPLDLFINHYFRAHKALGSKDRGFIAETVYSLVRWRDLLDHLCEKPISWEKRLQVLSTTNLAEIQKRDDIPLHIRLSHPKILFDLIVQSHGQEKACQICLANNLPAPTTVRCNPLKTTRDDLLERWQNLYSVSPCQWAPNGITFHKKINFFSLAEYKEGLFEVQDEGSQLLANLVDAQPGQLILDYCAGSGGKTLAFAPKMGNTGQIYLHDIRAYILQESRQRLRRAGIQNAQVIQAEDVKLKKLKKKMAWVLVDVPCSGSGTIRRNPDMKWKFSEEALVKLVGQQRSIFEKALSFMHPEGRIVYGTCSLLKEENQDQVEHFLKIYPLELVGPYFQSLPTEGGMDGFFGAVLKYR